MNIHTDDDNIAEEDEDEDEDGDTDESDAHFLTPPKSDEDADAPAAE
jgi:hypothetical protein